MPNEINWNEATKPVSLRLNLTDLEIDVTHEATFLSIRQNTDRSARYGAQNGLGSLLLAAENSLEDGDSYCITKVTSEKSPAGYAFRWTTV